MVTDMSNAELQQGVSDELSLDTKVHNRAIAVHAHDGAVTLRGTVGSFREKRETMTAARRVPSHITRTAWLNRAVLPTAAER